MTPGCTSVQRWISRLVYSHFPSQFASGNVDTLTRSDLVLPFTQCFNSPSPLFPLVREPRVLPVSLLVICPGEAARTPCPKPHRLRRTSPEHKRQGAHAGEPAREAKIASAMEGPGSQWYRLRLISVRAHPVLIPKPCQVQACKLRARSGPA